MGEMSLLDFPRKEATFLYFDDVFPLCTALFFPLWPLSMLVAVRPYIQTMKAGFHFSPGKVSGPFLFLHVPCSVQFK